MSHVTTRPAIRHALQYGSSDYNSFIAHADAVASQLTAAEAQAVFEYTGWFYAGYQEFLNRDADAPVKLSDASYVAGVEHLDTATAKTVCDDARTLYRGGVVAEIPQVGDDVVFTSYISTSVNPQVAVDIIKSNPNGVIYEFLTTDGIELNDATSEQGLREKEVLLGRNKTFTVANVHHNVEFKNGSRSSRHTVVVLR